MARNNKSRLAKKQRRKDRRKLKKKLKEMVHARKIQFKEIGKESNHSIDQGPSTSRHCKKQLSPKRSPWQSAGGKVNRFKKIVDDQTRRIVKRTVYMADKYQALRKLVPLKATPQKKDGKRLLNKRKSRIKKLKTNYSHNVSSSLEEGEIRSHIDRSFESTAIDTKNNDDDYEDDCMVIEPTLEEITVDDDDDNIPSTSDVSTYYQSVINSFRDCVSSTPCHSRKSPSSLATVVNAQNKNDKLPFFVDVGPSCGTESINSTENFTDYIKLSTLNEKSQPKCRSVDNSEVIELDDASNDKADITLKPKAGDICDDSVIFVSETNKNDFIPIVDDNIPPQKILKISESTEKSRANRLRSNNLFTQRETKILNEYNENAYNPSTRKESTSDKRIVIIDGSNVAFKHGLDQEFSVKGLKIAIEYFEKLGHEVKAVIPQFRMNKTKSTNPEELERLHRAGKIVQTPCKNLPGHTSSSYDDRFILQLAFAMDGAIVSNDNYRDLLFENPAFRKIIENRVTGYTWCNDIFILPKDPYGKWGPSLHTILNRH